MRVACQKNIHKLAISSQLRNVVSRQINPAVLTKCVAFHSSATVNEFKEDFQTNYSVRPTGFWADKILQHESKKSTAQPSKPRKLIDRTMKDSYMEEYLPFKSLPELLEEYVFSDGTIRTGKLLEDLDALAGAIAYKHIDNGDQEASPVTIVTASVDRLDLFLPKAGVQNYKLSGHVTYVGSSSMEIFIKAETVPEDEFNNSPHKSFENPENLGILGRNTVLATRFTMVAIDSITQKPVKINPLKLTSPAEERLFEMAEANKKRKRRAAETSLTRQPPTPEERLDIHDIFLQYSQYLHGEGTDDYLTASPADNRQPLPEHLVWMRDTKIESNFIMQPQDRNIHNNIFGGYLMRRAYELAYANTALFMKTSSPTLLSMDEVTFRKPVHVGTLLNLRSAIVLSEGYPHRTVQVRVMAEVVNMEKNTRETTNVFHFTLASGNDKIKLRRILPRTYAETMLWIDAKRRRFQGIHARHAMLEAGIAQN
ncbi:Acyl-coenzyme A thioesterase 9, mitochondrial [Choanephora cucurbitarum]|uniref:Acyl-coenzyme A thioesterase 9, mitochondrial n=1 Tax=Choanephora cucurbitarum TaxID=101091 RepID=A0A1C7NET4_9FUNG|nr:Acyl-coenzyme A thioesterase 9, mitochondrial [Choanephora cucurbitarum]